MTKEHVLIIGGTGSLGRTLLKHFVDDYHVSVFSRDEAKHVLVKEKYPTVVSLIGDIRDRDAVFNAIMRSQPDIIINAAALKNVPEVEEVPMEGIRTSLEGTNHLNHAALMYAVSHNKQVKVLTVSTDKACKPVNSYGMAKALQERLHIRSNSHHLVCNAVRYGNVLESRGSIIPLIKMKIQCGEAVSITDKHMTRFFLTLDDSVQLIKKALDDDEGGKVFVPIIRSAKIVDLVDVFYEWYKVDKSKIVFSSIRPGEKLDELMVSQEELLRTEKDGNYYVIHDILAGKKYDHITTAYSSGNLGILLTKADLKQFLVDVGVLDAVGV